MTESPFLPPPAPPPAAPEPPRPPAKKRSIVGLTALFLFLVSTLVGLVRDTARSIARGQWPNSLLALSLFLLFALIAFRSLRRFLSGREEYRRRFLATADNVRPRDAIFYSLTHTGEILRSIPSDRKRLVRIAFVLIGVPFAWLALSSGIDNLAVLALYLLLALAGVNLLIWAVAAEREERTRLQIELETARQMQMALMPGAAPALRGFDIAGVCLPAQSVGGDQYDFVWLGRERRTLGVAVVDVSGKGMDAALTAVYTSGAFVSQAQFEAQPASIMRNLNAALRSRRDRRRFVSFLLAAVDADARQLRCINAGQCRPLLWRDNRLSEISGSGPRFPLGARDRADYVPSELALQAGDRLLFYTDGVIDAENAAEEPFGLPRLQEALGEAATGRLPAAETVEQVRRCIAEFSAGTEPRDDITMVALHVDAAAAAGATR